MKSLHDVITSKEEEFFCLPACYYLLRIPFPAFISFACALLVKSY
jgi:hypothetical protein